MTQEMRTFDIIDDNSESLFIGTFSRTQEQVKPELWALQIGDYLNLHGETPPCRAIMRHS